jgi:hypothetical protein
MKLLKRIVASVIALAYPPSIDRYVKQMVEPKFGDLDQQANAANPPNQRVRPNGHITLAADAISTLPASANTTGMQGRYLLCKKGTDENHFAISSAKGEVCLGITYDEATAIEDPIDIAVLGAVPGTVFMVAGAAIADAALLISAGDGTAITHDAATQWIVGKALQAAGAAGDVIEVIPMCVHVVTIA